MRINKHDLSSILICIVLVSFFSNAYSQVQKGDMNIGFSSSFSTQSGTPRNMIITGLISAERFFTDNISVGLGPVVSVITSDGSLTSIYGANLFGNYNFLTKGGKLLPYVGILGSINQSISNSDTKSQQNGNQIVNSGNSTVSFYGAGAKVGTKYFITEKINLDANVNYATNIYSTVNGEKLDIGDGGQIQIFLGLGVILGGKKNK